MTTSSDQSTSQSTDGYDSAVQDSSMTDTTEQTTDESVQSGVPADNGVSEDMSGGTGENTGVVQ